ncbi:MAG: FAD:protein FMN transferase [Oscillospiraceae bacterium]
MAYQLYGDEAKETCTAIDAMLTDFEASTSMYKQGSCIDNINRNAGGNSVEIDDATYDVLARSLEISGLHEGVFDITVGALTKLWNINSDEPHVPKDDDIKSAKALVDCSGFELRDEQGTHTARLSKEGQAIDLGGVAKGYALDLCKEQLEKSNVDYGLISIGGNVCVYGDKGGEKFTVGIRVPKNDSEDYYCAVKLADAIVSTTGAYERYFVENGVKYHHIIDINTGYPAVSDVVSVTVIGQNGALADYYSTYCFISGLEKTLEMMADGEVTAIVMDTHSNVFVSKSLESQLVLELCDTGNYNFQFR